MDIVINLQNSDLRREAFSVLKTLCFTPRLTQWLIWKYEMWGFFSVTKTSFKPINVGQCPTWWPPCRIHVAPSVQRRKVWLTPTARVPCSNAAKTRNPLKFAGVYQTNERISAISGPKFTILWAWGHVAEILLFNKFFFRPSIHALVAPQSCVMVPRWPFFCDFWVLHFQQATCSTFQTCILNSH